MCPDHSILNNLLTLNFVIVRLWNIQEKRNLVSYNGHAYTVWDVGMNLDETYFVSASLDKTLRLWNTEYACPLRILAGHSDSVDVSVLCFI